MGRGSTDKAWEHCKSVDGKRNYVKCNYCKHIMGGVTRMKQHLAQWRGDVKPCTKCPLEVTLEMKEQLLQHFFDRDEKQMEKRKLQSTATNTEAEERSTDDHVEVDETAALEQAIQESLRTHEMERKRAAIVDEEFEAACRESKRSYEQQLLSRGEGCSGAKAGPSDVVDCDSEDYDFDLDYDSDLGF